MKKLIPILLLVIALTACSPKYTHQTVNYNIQYEVTGSTEQASVIIYVNNNGDAVTLTNIDLPWTFSTTIESGTNVILSAWADVSGSYDYIATSINKDGSLWKLDSDSGSGYSVHALIEEELP